MCVLVIRSLAGASVTEYYYVRVRMYVCVQVHVHVHACI